MKTAFIIKFLLIVSIFSFFLFGCSSSSYSERYKENKPTPNSNTTKARFSSNNNVSKKSGSNTKNFNSEFDIAPVEDHPVNMKAFIKKYKKFEKLSNVLTDKEKVIFEIIRLLGTPYKYGGNTDQGIDCSAFTQQVYKGSLLINLPRTVAQQFKLGKEIDRINKLKFGDLLFFETKRGVYPSHVGIYLGADKFAHASLSQGVTISSLKSTYYAKRFVGAKRIDFKLNK